MSDDIPMPVPSAAHGSVARRIGTTRRKSVKGHFLGSGGAKDRTMQSYK